MGSSMERGGESKKMNEFPEIRPEVEEYARALLATGMDEREVARAAFYANHYGMEIFESSKDCVFFDKPDCGDWNCLNPEHQVIVT